MAAGDDQPDRLGDRTATIEARVKRTMPIM